MYSSYKTDEKFENLGNKFYKLYRFLSYGLLTAIILPVMAVYYFGLLIYLSILHYRAYRYFKDKAVTLLSRKIQRNLIVSILIIITFLVLLCVDIISLPDFHAYVNLCVFILILCMSLYVCKNIVVILGEFRYKLPDSDLSEFGGGFIGFNDNVNDIENGVEGDNCGNLGNLVVILRILQIVHIMDGILFIGKTMMKPREEIMKRFQKKFLINMFIFCVVVICLISNTSIIIGTFMFYNKASFNDKYLPKVGYIKSQIEKCLLDKGAMNHFLPGKVIWLDKNETCKVRYVKYDNENITYSVDDEGTITVTFNGIVDTNYIITPLYRESPKDGFEWRASASSQCATEYNCLDVDPNTL